MLQTAGDFRLADDIGTPYRAEAESWNHERKRRRNASKVVEILWNQEGHQKEAEYCKKETDRRTKKV